MKVFFTHAYFMNEDEKEKRINKPYPPLGILYLSAWLEKHGYDNEVFDSTFSDKATQFQSLRSSRPDIIAIYTNLVTKLNVIDLIARIRKEPLLGDTLIVLGGPDVTYNIENYLGVGADVLVIGEGEQSMLEIVQACENGLRPHFGHIPGLAYLEEDGSIIRTKKRIHLRQLDELPFPNRKKIDINAYLQIWRKYHGKGSVSISTQRGCPYTCRWCSTAVFGQSYRRRSPANVVDELVEIKKNYNPDHAWFVDDVFTVSHKWLIGFKNEIKRRKVEMPFECITRADRLNEDVIAILKESGCFRVWIGAESGSQKVLDAMDRRVDAKHVQEMIVATRTQGIEAGTFIMLGYPGETEKDIVQTLQHLKNSNPDQFTITLAYPIRGTGLFEEVKNKIVDAKNWTKSTDRDLDFERTYPRAYYNFAIRWVVNSVQLNKRIIEQKAITLTSFKLWLKTVLSRMAMWWYRNIKNKRVVYGVSEEISKRSERILPGT